MNSTKRNVFHLITLLFFFSGVLFSCSLTKKNPGKKLLIRNSIKVENESIPAEEFNGFLRQKENKRILYAFRFHSWVYTLGQSMKDRSAIRDQKSKNRVAKRKLKEKKINYAREERRINGGVRNYLMKTVGEEPVFLDSFLVSQSASQMELYCKTKGFFHAKVRDSIAINSKNRAKVFYFISPGSAYTISEISYNANDPLIRAFILANKSKSLLSPGMRYDEDALDAERSRINDELKNNGYFAFSKSYITYDIDSTLGNKTMKVNVNVNRRSVKTGNGEIRFYDHQRYFIREVYITPNFQPYSKEIVTIDTVQYFLKNRKSERIDTLYFLMNGKSRVKKAIIASKIFMRPGSIFRLKDVIRTQNNLSDMAVFRYINIHFEPDTTNSDTGKSAYLNAFIDLSKLPIHSGGFDVEGTNSAGDYGLNGNISYKNRSLFKGGEILDIRLKGGLEVQQSIIGEEINGQGPKKIFQFNSYYYGGDVRIDFPRLLLPVRLEKISLNAHPRTQMLLSLNFQKQPDYERILSQISLGYSFKETSTKTHQFQLPFISLVKIRPDSLFEIRIQSLPRVLRSGYEDYLAAGVKYTFNFNGQKSGKNKNYRYLKINFESSGLLLRTGNILFNSFREGQIYKIFNIRYAQYARIDGDYRQYLNISPKSQLVFREFIGLGLPYGNSRVLPFERMFSAGGSNDIRAWRFRSLGPGNYGDSLKFDKSGDIALVLNAEVRFPMVSYLKGAVFVDAGNVWLVNPNDYYPGGEFQFNSFLNQIAIGTGIGFRLDFSFFIFRVDLAFPMRNPSLLSEKQWTSFNQYWQMKNINFGIGYPF